MAVGQALVARVWLVKSSNPRPTESYTTFDNVAHLWISQTGTPDMAIDLF